MDAIFGMCIILPQIGNKERLLPYEGSTTELTLQGHQCKIQFWQRLQVLSDSDLMFVYINRDFLDEDIM